MANHLLSNIDALAAGDRDVWRRWMLTFAFAALLLMLLVVGVLFARYLEEPTPLPELIPLPLEIAYRPRYLFSINGIDQPVGVAVSPDGERIYVSESGGERLVKYFDRDGDPLGSMAPPISSPVQRAPVYLAVEPGGRVLVTDRIQGSIQVYDPDGVYLGDVVSVPELAAGWAPLGIRMNPGGSVLITNVVGETHFAVQLPLALLLDEGPAVSNDALVFGAGGDGMSFPNVAVSDSQGRVYVTDGNNGRVSIWDQKGNLLAFIGLSSAEGMLNLPRGAAIDESDRLHVVDAVGQNVKVYDLSGPQPEFLFSFGDWGTGQAEFNYPNDIAIDDSGRLYIADRENHRVQVWSY